MRIISLLLFIIGGLVGFAAWQSQRDPLTSLPAPEHNLTAETSALLSPKSRHIEHIALHSVHIGEVGFSVSLPDPLPKERLPILIVLGGLGTGENNTRYVNDAGSNAIIGYDWPMPVHFYSGATFILQMPELYSRLMMVPAQIASMVSWLASQPWADNQRISILGFSLGALAAPVAQNITDHDGSKVGWTILAYGGAPFGDLFANNPHIKPVWMRDILPPAIDILLAPLEADKNLPQLSGQFLILEGRDDALIPAAARANLRDATPEPKTIITFDGNHMGVGQDKMALLQKIIDTSKGWLIEKGAVNAR